MPPRVSGVFVADREVGGGRFGVPAPPGVGGRGPRGWAREGPAPLRGEGPGKRLSPGREGRSRGDPAWSLQRPETQPPGVETPTPAGT